MIAVDTNLLVYAHRSDAEFHKGAHEALCQLANQGVRWTIPWPCVHEFIAVTTHARIFDPPSPLELALDAIEIWLKSPNCIATGEGFDYFDTLKALALSGKIRGPMIHDARIAAICLENGITELWTVDRDFSRFGELKTHNPLTGN
ncbi:MAG: TA system VapC family ribonuclease toxin [Opitutales bacterium]